MARLRSRIPPSIRAWSSAICLVLASPTFAQQSAPLAVQPTIEAAQPIEIPQPTPPKPPANPRFLSMTAGGGLVTGVGLAILLAGIPLAKNGLHDCSHSVKCEAGGALLGIGGIHLISGIPLLAVGIRYFHAPVK